MQYQTDTYYLPHPLHTEVYRYAAGLVVPNNNDNLASRPAASTLVAALVVS